MNLGYPTLRPQPEGTNVAAPKNLEGPFGVPDVMLHGLNSVRHDLTHTHPLEYSEQNYSENKMKMDFAMLRNTQGCHAPLKLQMERNTAKKIQRLPGLHSSNIMSDTLTGKLDTIEFDDILHNPQDSEVMGQPHAMMEKQLRLL